MKHRRKTVYSLTVKNGHVLPIGRGTVVRWKPERRFRNDDPNVVQAERVGVNLWQAVGIVESLTNVVDDAGRTAQEQTNWAGARVIFGKGGRCTRLHLPVRDLEVVGEVKRVPKCVSGDALEQRPSFGFGRWVRSSDRKHRVRDAEIAKEAEGIRGDLRRMTDFETRTGVRPIEAAERPALERRLVVLDRKLERLPVGPRRKHR